MRTRDTRKSKALTLLSATLVACVVACGSSSLRAAGVSCTTSNDCAAGLSCLGLAQMTGDGGCTTVAQACTKSCLVDSDCSAVGSTFHCFPACDGTRTCAQTE